jgi:hypothetical protein
MTAKSLLNHLLMLDNKYGLDEVPVKVFHNEVPCPFKFKGISLTMEDRRVKEIQINVTKDNKFEP